MHILALYAGLLGFLLIFLSYNVVKYRKQFKIGIGDGAQDDLARPIRVHANFTEYVPIALILLGVLEANAGDELILHIAGASLVIARLMHAIGLGKSTGTSTNRFLGVVITWLVILGLAGYNIFIFVSGAFMSTGQV